MMALQNAVFSALNVASLLALAPGGVHSPIAPDGTAYPYVRIQWGQGETDWTLGRQVAESIPFDVIAVVLGFDATPLESIKAQVDTLLNNQPLTLVGTSLWTLRKVGEIPTYAELGNDGQMRLYGGCAYRAVVGV